jgi:hypothetical protein
MANHAVIRAAIREWMGCPVGGLFVLLSRPPSLLSHDEGASDRDIAAAHCGCRVRYHGADRLSPHPEERRRRVSKGGKGMCVCPCFETPLRGSSA